MACQTVLSRFELNSPTFAAGMGVLLGEGSEEGSMSFSPFGGPFVNQGVAGSAGTNSIASTHLVDFASTGTSTIRDYDNSSYLPYKG